MELTEIPDNRVKVALVGRLDSPGVDKIESRFTGALAPASRHVLVDLSRVEFIASLGIRMLISTARILNRKGAKFVLVAPQEAVKEVFENVSLGDIIPIFDNEADAVAALSA